MTGCPAKPRRVRGAGAAALGMCLYLRSKAGLRWLPLVICAPLALSADRDLPPTERARGPVDDRLSFGSCVYLPVSAAWVDRGVTERWSRRRRVSLGGVQPRYRRVGVSAFCLDELDAAARYLGVPASDLVDGSRRRLVGTQMAGLAARRGPAVPGGLPVQLGRV